MISTLASKLEHLYDSHARGLFCYLLTFTKSESDAKDLLQETFVKLAATGGRVDIQNEKSFVFQVAHHLAIDWLRRRSTRLKAEAILTQQDDIDAQASNNPDIDLISKCFSKAMETLPPEQRSIAHLKLSEELTFEEIAQAQGIPLNTAASRYRYAIDKLRALLRPLYEELK